MCWITTLKCSRIKFHSLPKRYNKIRRFERAKAVRRELGGGGGGVVDEIHACFYTSEYIKTTRDKIKTNQMDL